ncbi:hypothetical protein ACTHGU_00510 [Chitinophagaceae bacterium MMS25-I14]
MNRMLRTAHSLFTSHCSTLSIILVFAAPASFAQDHDSSIFSLPVQMDEVTIKAAREGWDVGAFIKRVKEDTTFYKAFRSLHLVPYTAVNDIKIFNSSGGTQASLYSTTQQFREKNCRTMKVLSEQVTGDYYKRNGDCNYYTGALYASLFFIKQQVCGENDVVAGGIKEERGGRMEKNKNQLKQLIFNPGSSVHGVPFVGNKAAIFDPEISKMYHFKLLSVDYDGEDCYLFQAIPKPEYAADVVYNELSTWFRKSDYAIVARNYSLSYHTMIFDFDVSMKVRLRNVAGKLLPARIEYKGNWHVMTKGRERGAFVAEFKY